ncbi:receptor protein kinase-like protein At4g34220 [Argentina anserina]|uniref:receptor protein kinase-like protein At4g34220 n=1 Tax=Argentina anserina TaxID=57926 RepID=UPI0021767032|nr:receptor protein kinase-like protein At4g34220 [Potentilla anserina]
MPVQETMMSSKTQKLCFWWRLVSLLILAVPSLSLNSDGVFLLAFKYAILSDPLSVLESWNYEDETPCSWSGVTCTQLGNPGTSDMFRVTSLVLPNSQLLGSIAEELGLLEHLAHLDLSNNFFNGSLPKTVLNASELQVLSLSNNVISGELPESIGDLKSLQLLNISDNALAGKVPQNLTSLQNLTVVSLRSNYFAGNVPTGFNSVEVLDLSSNLLNGSLPLDFGGNNFRYLNLSYNKIGGKIPSEFAEHISVNSTIDLSFNNLTGPIPDSEALLSQKTEQFAGNNDLCGKPLKKLCAIPSTLSTPPNVTSSSPAIAAIPKTLDSNPETNTSGTPSSIQTKSQTGLKPVMITGIIVGDLAGITIIGLVILYVYQVRKKSKNNPNSTSNSPSDLEKKPDMVTKFDAAATKPSAWSCLTIKGEETSEATSSDSDHDEQSIEQTNLSGENSKRGVLITVDGEPELDLETLLKASAYVLGASGPSIVYKAVLEDKTALAVRRIGESVVEKMRDFENQVRAIAKMRHPNLVRVRGFYWGEDEKLVIYDYVSNGSLAGTINRKAGSSPYHLPLEVRLKIARGIARGLGYIHEKKNVHGNIKPSNILLNSDFDPVISDFGLDRLMLGGMISHKGSGSARGYFGSLKSAGGREGMNDMLLPVAGSPIATSSAGGALSLYQAPESLKNLRPNPKWDVYSFGIVLLELLTGRVFSERELADQWTAGSLMGEKNRVLVMVDMAIRAEVEGREDVLQACLKLGFSCASFVPQKRPTMKEVLQVLEKSISSCQ